MSKWKPFLRRQESIYIYLHIKKKEHSRDNSWIVFTRKSTPCYLINIETMFEPLPASVARMIGEIHTASEATSIDEAFTNGREFTALRVNRLRTTPEETERELNDAGIPFQKIPWLQDGYLLPNIRADALWKLPAYLEGRIYLQWFSSQLVWELLRPYLTKETRVLDIAAAPWGKSSHLSAILENQGQIVACEKNQIRFEKLLHTIQNQGCKNVESLHLDALKLSSKFPPWSFDLILADVPCSASGKILYRQEKSYGYFHNPWVDEKNASVQKSLLDAILPLLKKWGKILYSTCTISPLENEGIIDTLLTQYTQLSPIDLSEAFQHPQLHTLIKVPLKNYRGKEYHPWVTKSIRILPSSHMEWFYISLLQNS